MSTKQLTDLERLILDSEAIRDAIRTYTPAAYLFNQGLKDGWTRDEFLIKLVERLMQGRDSLEKQLLEALGKVPISLDNVTPSTAQV